MSFTVRVEGMDDQHVEFRSNEFQQPFLYHIKKHRDLGVDRLGDELGDALGHLL